VYCTYIFVSDFSGLSVFFVFYIDTLLYKRSSSSSYIFPKKTLWKTREYRNLWIDLRISCATDNNLRRPKSLPTFGKHFGPFRFYDRPSFRLFIESLHSNVRRSFFFRLRNDRFFSTSSAVQTQIVLVHNFVFPPSKSSSK